MWGYQLAHSFEIMVWNPQDLTNTFEGLYKYVQFPSILLEVAVRQQVGKVFATSVLPLFHQPVRSVQLWLPFVRLDPAVEPWLGCSSQLGLPIGKLWEDCVSTIVYIVYQLNVAPWTTFQQRLYWIATMLRQAEGIPWWWKEKYRGCPLFSKLSFKHNFFSGIIVKTRWSSMKHVKPCGWLPLPGQHHHHVCPS